MTYKIIGADGREYGPVSLAELQDWGRQGRVAATTQVLRSDGTTWKYAVDYPELELARTAAPPPLFPAEGGLQPVGFWPRVGAQLIDSMLIGILFYLLMGRTRPADAWNLAVMFKQTVYEMILTAIYYVSLNGSIGATVGKLVIGARIVFLDGSKIGYGTALMRWLASILSGLLLGIGYLMVAFREDKRALHDLLVGTRVVYRR